MTHTARGAQQDVMADPFREHSVRLLREEIQVLGGRFCFETASADLLQLIRAAFAGLPAHRLSSRVPRFRIRLELTPSRKPGRTRREPPAMTLLSGAGYLCGATPASNVVIMSPDERKALLVISPEMARFAYHTRYELIELAVYMLAARWQGLVSLHAGCVGIGNRGVLLVGASGSGKSTLALHCMLDGFDLVSEDSALVAPETLRATGLANFLHIQREGLQFLAGSVHARRIRKSPLIRRRSGVTKLEVDLRRLDVRLAAAPVRIVAVIFTTAERADVGAQLLVPLRKAELAERLSATQAYAANNVGWDLFQKKLSRLQSFELRRAEHPRDGVRALRQLLSGPAR